MNQAQYLLARTPTASCCIPTAPCCCRVSALSQLLQELLDKLAVGAPVPRGQYKSAAEAFPLLNGASKEPAKPILLAERPVAGLRRRGQRTPPACQKGALQADIEPAAVPARRRRRPGAAGPDRQPGGPARPRDQAREMLMAKGAKDDSSATFARSTSATTWRCSIRRCRTRARALPWWWPGRNHRRRAAARHGGGGPPW